MILFFEQARDRIADAVRHVHPMHLALGGLGAMLLLAIVAGEVFIPIAFLGIALGLVVLWAHEFLTLMRAPDAAFPGRFDKLIWGIALVILPPIGAPVFWVFRRGLWDADEARANKPHGRPWMHDEV